MSTFDPPPPLVRFLYRKNFKFSIDCSLLADPLPPPPDEHTFWMAPKSAMNEGKTYLTSFTPSSFYNLSFAAHSEGDDLIFVLSDVVGPSLVDEYEPTLCWWVFLVRAWRNFDGFSIQCNLSRFEDNVEIKFRESETPWSVKYLETHWWCGFDWNK